MQRRHNRHKAKRWHRSPISPSHLRCCIDQRYSVLKNIFGERDQLTMLLSSERS